MNTQKVRRETAYGLPSPQLLRNTGERKVRRARAGFVACVAGLILAGIVGIVCLDAARVDDAPMLHAFGSASVMLVIPLLLAAGWLLDKLEDAQDAARAAQAEWPRAVDEDDEHHDTGASAMPMIAPVALLLVLVAAPSARAAQLPTAEAAGSSEPAATAPAADAPAPMTERERALLERVERLEQRLAELEAAHAPAPAPAPALEPSATPAAAVVNIPPAATVAADEPTLTKEDRGVLDFFRGTTFNVTLDGYYGYNFNTPVGGVNLLRPYDVTSNSFNLNQAALVIEQAPDVEAGRRYGMRLDLQWGQATETVQGSAANEQRPQTFRNVLQAYGTYVAPLGKGVTIDFGKWVSSLGYEGNYTKDQINYSRSYWFNYLPFYHEGVRAAYPITDKITATYWLVNGAQQTEDFNGFKSQAIALDMSPAKSLKWHVQYYEGIEGRSYVPNLNPGFPTIPSQPGLPVDEFRPSPRGRENILDTYASWNATDRLLFAGEFDYVVNRAEVDSPPLHVIGGAGYARFQIDPRNAIAARAEYLSDRGGLFSGYTQALKETTVTYEYRFAEGLLTRLEWRRDFSNQPFFLTQQPGVLSKQQNTATIGLVWWMGRKTGSW